MAEDKICPDADALDFLQVSSQTVNELLTSLLAECLIKMDQQERVGTKRFDGAQFLWERINKGRDAGGRNDGIRVTIKSNHERDSIVLTRVANGLANDLLMPEMHAVKKANGQTHFAGGSLKLGG